MSIKNSTTVDTCGCCETGPNEPGHINRPGQSEIAYRLGTHPTFLKRMMARLASQELPDGPNAGQRPLVTLTSRATEDPVIALLDAGAVLYDVLSFYQERIANEGFLRTATERRSILELARSIGYELNPGVTAGTYLAFTVDDSDTTPAEAPIPAGTQVQSIPMAQDELPQTFETTEAFEAHVEWNTLYPQTTQPQLVLQGTKSLYFKGISNNLEPGDLLLMVVKKDNAGTVQPLRIREVQTDVTNNYTLVKLASATTSNIVNASEIQLFALREKVGIYGHNAPRFGLLPAGGNGVDASNIYHNWDGSGGWEIWKDSVKAPPGTPPPGTPPDPSYYEDADVYLERVISGIVEGSWVILEQPSEPRLVYTVTETTEASLADFAISAKVTGLELADTASSPLADDTNDKPTAYKVRKTTAYVKSEALDLAEKPIPSPVYGNQIVLDRLVEGLESGQPLIISGQPVQRVVVMGRTQISLVSEDAAQRIALESGDILQLVSAPSSVVGGDIKWHLMADDGFAGFVTAGPDDIIPETISEETEATSEVVIIDKPLDTEGRTTITLQDPLETTYGRTTVTLYGNVVPATHGETVANEVVGSGDGAQRNQSFTLNKSPLTYVSAATASGAESSLTLRVNDVAWQAVASLYDQTAHNTVYTVRLDDDGKTQIILGDGKCGTRLPTGQENIRATYRAGLGSEGEVGAESLTLLKTRPFGIRSVTNPLAAMGAADPETRDTARTNAPLTVLTLDRIVSLRDFEDFARAFTGLGKAKATNVWNGETYLVHLTIADDNGDAVPNTSALYRKLQAAIDAARDPTALVLIDSYTLLTFKLEATLQYETRYLVDHLQADVEAALLSAFSFNQRDFGQPVTAAEVISVIHQVEGVVAVDLDVLYTVAAPGGSNRTGANTPAKLASLLPAQSARRAGTDILPAELLLLDGMGVMLTLKAI